MMKPVFFLLRETASCASWFIHSFIHSFSLYFSSQNSSSSSKFLMITTAFLFSKISIQFIDSSSSSKRFIEMNLTKQKTKFPFWLKVVVMVVVINSSQEKPKNLSFFFSKMIYEWRPLLFIYTKINDEPKKKS